MRQWTVKWEGQWEKYYIQWYINEYSLHRGAGMAGLEQKRNYDSETKLQ